MKPAAVAVALWLAYGAWLFTTAPFTALPQEGMPDMTPFGAAADARVYAAAHGATYERFLWLDLAHGVLFGLALALALRATRWRRAAWLGVVAGGADLFENALLLGGAYAPATVATSVKAVGSSLALLALAVVLLLAARRRFATRPTPRHGAG